MGILGGTLIFLHPLYTSAVTVGPAKIEYAVNPGETVSGELFLMNDSEETKTFHPVFEKFIEVNGEKKFLPGEPTALTAWLKMPASVTLPARQYKQVPFSIILPKNAPPGGHFAVIWWSTVPPNANGGARIVTRAGILVYLRVSGDIDESAAANFKTSGIFFSHIPDSFSVELNNTGNVYLKPSGEIKIKNIFSGLRKTFSINKHGQQVLPKSQRGLYIEEESSTWNNFGVGIYTAEMNLVYGENPKYLTDTLTFVVFTWQILLPILTILALLIFSAIKGIRGYNQWVITRYTKSTEPEIIRQESIRQVEYEPSSMQEKQEAPQPKKKQLRSRSLHAKRKRNI